MIAKPCLRTLLLTFDSAVVFLLSCFTQEVGIVSVLSILIASFTSFNLRVQRLYLFLPFIRCKK